jgi:hypothetical protein
VPRGERVANIDDGDDIEEETLELIVARVRQQILASLEKAALEDGALDFAEDAVARGIVEKAIADDDEEVWVPVDASRMRLRDRVRSLFVADYLNAPESYAELFVCHRCEAVVFDEGASASACAARTGASRAWSRAKTPRCRASSAKTNSVIIAA